MLALVVPTPKYSVKIYCEIYLSQQLSTKVESGVSTTELYKSLKISRLSFPFVFRECYIMTIPLQQISWENAALT